MEDPPATTVGGDETILLVEDEPAILEMTVVMLESLGYKVLSAATPSEAFALAKQHADTISMMITDVVMPEMTGPELVKHLKSLHLQVEPLYMSGYTANVIAHHNVLDEGVHFIAKPFTTKELAIKVREVLDNNRADRSPAGSLHSDAGRSAIIN
jgi:DNA-binding NtrC family response regulator